jgi:hypothetical protein
MTFIVDSAGTSVVNSDHVTLRVVRQLRTAPVTLSQDSPLESWDVVEIESLRLGAEEIRDLKMLSRSLPQLEKQLGSEVDGILGADLLHALGRRSPGLPPRGHASGPGKLRRSA